LNDRRHIAWPKGKTPLWLHQRFTWPEHLQGYPLQDMVAKLALRWWAEQAEIYINGQLAHTGDIFDCWTRVELTEAVIPGESVEVSLKLLSPGHDNGALVKSQLEFEITNSPCPEPAFVADELAVLTTYLAEFAPEHLEQVADALGMIAWEQVGDCPQFHQSLARLRDSLQDFTPWLKQRTIHCLGHAHLDLAWLWPVSETWEAAQRTFESVLSLQTDFPELTFTHSSPALFNWLEKHRPELFQAIQQQIQAGRWAIDAGLWVEPDLNLPGGEALVRQILYGQRYCAEKFGQVSAIAWLPDTFGFSWQLPQLLTQGGIRYFATQKLGWNDTNPFPHHLFAWQGLDGTAITAVTLPPIGTDIDAVAMAEYACQWEASTTRQDCLWLPGVGDHGGGPTRDMLLKARRWANSPFFPTLTFGHAVPLFDQLIDFPNSAPESENHQFKIQNSKFKTLPLWSDELYLELHRGCYTTHGDQKFYNRRCEDTLFQAELWASIAAVLGLQPYPKTELEIAWKQVLFNQFHDILPGSSIPEVFEEANQGWQAALKVGNRILREALGAIAHACLRPAPPVPEAIPVMLFNSLNWGRSEVVSVPLPIELAGQAGWQVWDGLGEELSVQVAYPTVGGATVGGATVGGAHPTVGEYPLLLEGGAGVRGGEDPALLIVAPEIPSVGYRLLWLVPTDSPPQCQPMPDDWTLENQYLRASIDPATGNIASLFDKRTGQETLSAPGNQLQAFRDQGQYWDAWNIAPDYQAHPLANFQLQQMEWLENGPCRRSLRVVRTFGQSTVVQEYRLDTQSPYLVIHTRVDWQETQVLLKAAFPLTVRAPYATYEIPFGAIQRSTTAETSQAQAKWEVPALRWADLSQSDHGVSILTDYKHGFDATPNQLRLTLLKAPLWPDLGADRGVQTFTYAIYPHAGGWQAAKTVQMARNLNLPIQPCLLPPNPASQTSVQATATASYLDLGNTTLVLSAFKLAEDRENTFILRGYESTGESGTMAFNSSLPIRIAELVDGLERSTLKLPDSQGLSTNLPITPWQVISLAISLDSIELTPPLLPGFSCRVEQFFSH
jgi:alpha-mannosidase